MDTILQMDTVRLEESTGSLAILDQTQLPQKAEMLYLTTPEEIRDAIYRLKVRGAPAIGDAAAIGLYVCALRFEETERDAFLRHLRQVSDYLCAARPTAVNLAWALTRMVTKAEDAKDADVTALRGILREEAVAIWQEDISMCRAIGEYGLTLIRDGCGILTHCNAGQLATARYGTALAPIHVGREQGKHFRVFCDETRPLLQGARLSAYEMAAAGMDVTVICDNMASQVMKNGWIDAVFVGSDRIAANGDCCNKIGTSGVAILAAYYGIPFYVCAPTSTIDMTKASGADIVIEQRPEEEVTTMWYRQKMTPPGVKAYNPAFDVTPASLVTAIITERGICRPDYREAFAGIGL